MNTDYKAHAKAIDQRLANLYKATPKAMGAYQQLVKAAASEGALDTKTKELMALAISITSRCEDCIVYHTRAALKHGASEAEISETITVAMEMGGGPATVYGARAHAVYQALK